MVEQLDFLGRHGMSRTKPGSIEIDVATSTGRSLPSADSSRYDRRPMTVPSKSFQRRFTQGSVGTSRPPGSPAEAGSSRRLAAVSLLAILALACSNPAGPGPPGFSSQTIGFLGGSISVNSVKGRNALPEPSSWWAVEANDLVKFSGMHIHRWGQESEHRKWALFKQVQDGNPAKTLWFNILTEHHRTSSEILPSDLKEIDRIRDLLDEYAPTVETIYASGFPKVIWCVSQESIDLSWNIVDHGVEQGWWIEGPVLSPQTEELTGWPTDCHVNEEGMLIHGQDLLQGVG